MKIAVIILNWNGKELLKKFLPSVIQYSPEAEIFVADNASTDDSVIFVEKNFPQVKVIINRSNGGFAKGYNEALEQVVADVFVLLNSDVEVSPQWLSPIIKEFQESPNTAALQPKILDYHNKDYFEYAGAAGGFIDRLGYPYCRGRIFTTLEPDKGQYNTPRPIFWASGACMAIRKEAFHGAGGFDEDFFAHQEEIDLCWRLFQQGLLVKAIGESKVYHMGGGTLDAMKPRKTYYNFRNNLYLLLKNVPGPDIYFILLLRLILDGVAGLQFMVQGRPGHTLAIVKAHMSFYRNFPLFVGKRKKLIKRGKYYHRSSVLWKYYARGKKTFTQL